MVYLYGAGEVPISIVSDPEDEHLYEHTIRVVGQVTRGLAQVQQGQRLGFVALLAVVGRCNRPRVMMF